MPSNKNTQAAVPFVNQKGERSMKRVRVERYVAGKKPSYAKDEDEDEYYTTDDEINENEDESNEEEDGEGERAEEQVDGNESSDAKELQQEDFSDDDDDPRFMRLKEIESKTKCTPILPLPRTEENIILVNEDEDEEEIRERHRIARARRVEEPLQLQVTLGDSIDDRQNDISDAFHRTRKEQTEDILKDFKLEGIKANKNSEQDEKAAGEKLKDMLEIARQQAVFQAQLHKKIEEDRKRELEKEALNKKGTSGKDLEAVNTDDEDEEIAYAEWQLREIKRILRDKI